MKSHRYLEVFVVFFLFTTTAIQAQDTPPSETDSIKVVAGTQAAADSLNSDDNKVIEDAKLDIGQNRGLFILSKDGDMQLRILGSVRDVMVFDDLDLSFKNHLSTYEIPTGERNQYLPNYFNSLSQSRIGLEVTRKTSNGNIFIRLETDFAGQNGYRIRHAYGQYRNFTVGQTWSLFTHITSLIPTVSFGGPPGSVSIRTPQVRYTSKNIIPKYTLSFGLEYFKPQLNQLDTFEIKSFQIMPDVTARIEKKTESSLMQLSGLMTLLSGGKESGVVGSRLGWGAALSTVVQTWKKGKWRLQMAGGKGISRYINDFNGQGVDLILLPDGQTLYLPFAFGGYVGYTQLWTSKIASNFIVTALYLESKAETPDNAYEMGGSFIFNSFWNVVNGARIGLEYIHAIRVDKGGDRGAANRINLMFFYDF